jgi:hypothetical protein
MFTSKWAPACPVCKGPSVRDVRGRTYGTHVLECHCLLCGWYHTSPFSVAILRALSRTDCRCAQCSSARGGR